MVLCKLQERERERERVCKLQGREGSVLRKLQEREGREGGEERE